MLDNHNTADSDTSSLDQIQKNIIDIGHWVDQNGWCAATSGNLSARVDSSRIMITVSGNSKGSLSPEKLMMVDTKGEPFNSDQAPSAETLLHTLIYGQIEQANYVIHTHSVIATVFSRAIWQGEISFKNYEMQKAFSGVNSHEHELKVPVYANSQNMLVLAQQVEPYLQSGPDIPAFILAGHGVYSWGRDVQEARRHCEAMEFLLQCEYQSCLLLK